MGKISYVEFESNLQAGYPYRGLVERIGYVYWETETIYFYKVYKSEYGFESKHPQSQIVGFSGKPVYRQIDAAQAFLYRKNRYEVVSKTKYNIKTIPVKELYFQDRKLYDEYYDGNPPKFPPIGETNDKTNVNKNDAIPPPKNEKDFPENGQQTPFDPVEQIKRKIGAITKIGEKIDDSGIGLGIGVAAEFASKGNFIPVLDKILDALSIINDVNDGEYYSAAGTLIIACAGVYGTVADIAVWMYNTDYMQQGVAGLNAIDTKKAMYDYYYFKKRYEDTNEYKYHVKSEKAWKKYIDAKEDFKDNLDKLGIKYHE